MSEAKEEAPKKKGGKLPLILVLVLVLAGGGFFMMKGKGKKHKAKPAVVLGEIHPMPEFLVNLKGGVTYLRMEIGIQTTKGFEKKKVEEHMPALRDAVLMVLNSKGLKDIASNESKEALKKELAGAMNKALKASEPPEEEAEEEPKKKKKKKKKKHSEDSAHEKKSSKSDEESDEESDSSDEESEEELPEGMDGAGPILKVYFTNFATQ